MLLWGLAASKVNLRSPRSKPEVTRSNKYFFPILADSCSYLVWGSQKWTWGYQGQNLRSQGQKMTFSQFWLMLLFLSSKWFCLLWKLYLVTLLPMISLNDWYLDAPISYLHAFFYCPTRPELCDSRSLLFVYCSFCLLFNPSRRTMRSLIALVFNRFRYIVFLQGLLPSFFNVFVMQRQHLILYMWQFRKSICIQQYHDLQ